MIQYSNKPVIGSFSMSTALHATDNNMQDFNDDKNFRKFILMRGIDDSAENSKKGSPINRVIRKRESNQKPSELLKKKPGFHYTTIDLQKSSTDPFKSPQASTIRRAPANALNRSVIYGSRTKKEIAITKHPLLMFVDHCDLEFLLPAIVRGYISEIEA